MDGPPRAPPQSVAMASGGTVLQMDKSLKMSQPMEGLDAI
jgi:hypothetical protein